ncbi:MAG TPA: hypothetical protein VNL94_03645, partial [Candidatus Binatia bacterium]|nr:hypothetical protein [Candidatus Binatia bacterium]
MTEILTESFCERCGTRYTFEPVGGKRKPLSKIGTLGRGLKHFVTDPGSSLDEALAVARSEQEQRSTQTALEAFHRTFNFCLSCRQYTCADCWNAVKGRCLTCAPTADATPPATRTDTTVAFGAVDVDVAAAAARGGAVVDPMSANAIAEAEAAARAEAERLAAEAEAARRAAED